jgi:hypothetical protein
VCGVLKYEINLSTSYSVHAVFSSSFCMCIRSHYILFGRVYYEVQNQKTSSEINYETFVFQVGYKMEIGKGLINKTLPKIISRIAIKLRQ